jgi:NCS1 family nucleobase:cation symporter-1
LYREEGGTYPNFQIGAIIALIIGIIPNIPGFIRGALGMNKINANIFDDIYNYAWFTGFILSGLLHYAFATS